MLGEEHDRRGACRLYEKGTLKMIVSIMPGRLSGSVRAIASKSQAHRMLICAALADGKTEICCRELSQDIEATAGCLRALGADIERRGESLVVTPIEQAAAGYVVLDCGESGSTLRFMLPVVCALGRECTIKMHGRLPERPLEPLWSELIRRGAVLSKPLRDEIAVSGKIVPGEYTIAGNVSSQFISGLMFALPLVGGGRIRIEGELESVGYVDMTIRALEKFGVGIRREPGGFCVPGARRFSSAGAVEVEGDWSNAAFWLAAGELGSSVECSGLDPDSPQGDRAAVSALTGLGRGGEVDARNVPDLVPILAVAACGKKGATRFCGAGRLRIKESDRIKSVCAMLSALGGDVEETPDGLIVHGTGSLRGGTVSSAGDHRIAMSAAIASTICSESVTVEGAECVRKSYPAFWEDFVSLGGKVSIEE